MLRDPRTLAASIGVLTTILSAQLGPLLSSDRLDYGSSPFITALPYPTSLERAGLQSFLVLGYLVTSDARVIHDTDRLQVLGGQKC